MKPIKITKQDKFGCGRTFAISSTCMRLTPSWPFYGSTIPMASWSGPRSSR